MQENNENIIEIQVIKRDGKKVNFDGSKIALAIKKGFDSIYSDDKETQKYIDKDMHKIYNNVISKIEKSKKERIKIEEIQDLIEEELKINGYNDVYDSFKAYRERRAQSRQVFFDEKKQHKFLKALENLGLKSIQDDEIKKENNTIGENTAIRTMLQYGSTISKEFSKSYLMKRKFVEAHDSGDIYIHNMELLPIGATASCQIDLQKLYTEGFYVGHAFIREPNNIESYMALAITAIQANQNDEVGVQSIPAFDYYMAPGVLKTFKKQFKQTVYDFLELTDYIKFIAINGITREIDKLPSIEFDISIFDAYCRDADCLKKMFRLAYKKALDKTNKIVYQSIEAFITELNTSNSTQNLSVSLSFGTDTSSEGRMITTNFLLVTEKNLENGINYTLPISNFKIKEGINYNPEDKNYDLFKLACRISIKGNYPNFSFIDAPFNLQYYNSNDYNTEINYIGQHARAIDNFVDYNKSVTAGRGVLAYTSINLPRIGIKHGTDNGKTANMEEFYKDLEEKMDLVKDQLLERFEIQCSKNLSNFPFLLGQGVWLDSEKLKPGDKLRKVYKNGTLSIGFIGLAECLKALLGKHHGELDEAQKLGLEIIKFMRRKTDEYSEKYNLNFTLFATPNGAIAENFIAMDKAIFGKIKGITDKQSYTNSFHIPSNVKISDEKKITIEAPYHELANGGHICNIELKNNLDMDRFEKVIKTMKEAGIGQGSINSNNNL